MLTTKGLDDNIIPVENEYRLRARLRRLEIGRSAPEKVNRAGARSRSEA